MLKESQFVYIYGMSLGETDKHWWNRISSWLDINKKNHLIIQKYNMPEKTAFPQKYQLAERQEKNKFLGYSDLSDERKAALKNRIHVTGDNIFSDMKNMVNKSAPIEVPEHITTDMVAGVKQALELQPEILSAVSNFKKNLQEWNV